MKEQHGIAHLSLFIHLHGDLQCTLFADPLYDGKPLWLLLHHAKGILLKLAHYRRGDLRSDTLYRARAEILFHREEILGILIHILFYRKLHPVGRMHRVLPGELVIFALP